MCTLAEKSQATSILSQMREQEKQHEEDEEKKSEEEKQKQWRTMKLGFILMGGSLSVMTSIMIYELSRPSVDEKGNVIEDEFTNLPFFEQRFKRLFKELNYFKKVFAFLFNLNHSKMFCSYFNFNHLFFSWYKNQAGTNCFQIL